MKILINKYKFLIIIYLLFFITICILCFKRVSYSVTTTGDISNVSNFISIDNAYKENGSFNSIFVYSKDNASFFQKFAASLDSDATISKLNNNYSSFKDEELYQMGVIQKNQSIEASIINGYKMASINDEKINIDYKFEGIIVNYYIKDNNPFKLGDIIEKINDIDNSNEEKFLAAIKEEFKVGSKVKVRRDNKELEIVINEYSKISYYCKYDINYDTIYPKLKLNKTTSLGPSAGLLQSLSIYNKLIEEDITKGNVVCGTGTIDAKGNVGAIGGIEQKVIAAFKNGCQVFLCPQENYKDAYNKYLKIKGHEKMKIFKVSTFNEALEVLKNV